MAIIEIVKSSGKCICRGNKCNYRTKIPKDNICLSIYTGSASGFNTSYYCKDCMLEIFDQFEKAKFDLINGV